MKLGRVFNHLEDLVLFHGSTGAYEALDHLSEFNSTDGASSIRMKWDGSPQVYWGRESVNGPLIFAGHPGWSRNVKTSSAAELEQFIVHNSGNNVTDKSAREDFAKRFSQLYELFDSATPQDFVGFVYADLLFLETPVATNSVYSFTPNQTTYHISCNSELGQRVTNATALAVGHAFYPEFGMHDSCQQPLNNFTFFNRHTQLIVQGPIYNSSIISIDTNEIAQLSKFVDSTSCKIDNFLASVVGLKDLKDILYKYVNQSAKARQLDLLSNAHFFNWLSSSNVSSPKQQKIAKLEEEYAALDNIFHCVKTIMMLKDSVIDTISKVKGDIWETNGEGYVRYSDKPLGHIKLVPRKQWIPF